MNAVVVGLEVLSARTSGSVRYRYASSAKPKTGMATGCDPGEHDDEQDERDRARGQGEHDERRSRPAPPGLQREQAEQREGDAEGERELGCQGHSRPEERERAARPACCGAPLTFEQTGECAGRERDREHAEQRYSDKCGERVVEDAVVDEGVAPGVPEVVPEREAVQEEEPALVLVRREVAAARAEPDEQRRGERPEPGAEQGFARDRHPPGPPRRASVGRERDVPHGREAYALAQ